MQSDLSKDIEKLAELDSLIEGASAAAPRGDSHYAPTENGQPEGTSESVRASCPTVTPAATQDARAVKQPAGEESNTNSSTAARAPGGRQGGESAEGGDLSESEENEKVMTVVEHLDELRTRFIRCLLVFLLSAVVCFAFGKQIIQALEAPAGDMVFQALSIEEPLLVYCKVAFYAALVLSSPYLLFEAAAFVAPGLKRNERRVLMPIVVGGPLLFVAGVLFCYFLVLPPMLGFFGSFGTGIAPVQQRLDFYISLVTTMLFYMGLCFQLPIVLFALALAGLVNSRQLVSAWRYAIFGSALLAAFITPDPTVLSMVIVMAALVGLYFLTIGMLRFFGR